MYIDKYKIYNMRYQWKNGKQDKSESVIHSLHSEDSIRGKDFIALLSDLNDAWNKHESKDVEIEVTFKSTKED